MAQREGFEPSCGVIHKLISSQPRYDRFDTSPYILTVVQGKQIFGNFLWELLKS